MKHVARIGDLMRNSLSKRRRCEKSLQRFDEVYFNKDMEKLGNMGSTVGMVTWLGGIMVRYLTRTFRSVLVPTHIPMLCVPGDLPEDTAVGASSWPLTLKCRG